MEPNEVLKRFLDFCTNSNNQCSKYSFASNGILEWFGRNIKDNNNIFDFYRYNVGHQYEHIFSVAIKCEAFEEKALHKTTRNQPPDNILPSVSTTNVYKTPPSCSTSRDIFSTPPRKSHTVSPEQASNTDGDKLSNKLHDDYDEKPSPSITRTLRKRTIISPQKISPMKRNKKNSSKATAQTIISQSEECVSSPCCFELINYIEAIGTVRRIRKTKHRGIDVGSKEVCTFESPQRSYDGDGNTKLKISYRENVNRNDIQFVLVIYQNIERSPRCKRDLMAEFTKTCINETSERKVETKSKSNKIQKMKRLRF